MRKFVVKKLLTSIDMMLLFFFIIYFLFCYLFIWLYGM